MAIESLMRGLADLSRRRVQHDEYEQVKYCIVRFFLVALFLTLFSANGVLVRPIKTTFLLISHPEELNNG